MARLLLSLTVVLSTSCSHAVARAPKVEPRAPRPSFVSTFDAFWTLYHRHYGLFGIKRIDWDAVRTAYRPRAHAAASRVELFDLFTEVTDLLNDVHVSVRDLETGRFSRSGGRSIGTGPSDIGEFSLDLIASKFAVNGLTTRAGGLIHFGWLPQRIGYIHFGGFKYATSSEQAIDEFVARFKEARAVIIDVRQNSGGFDRVAKLIADRFALQRVRYMTVSNRVFGDDRNAFAPAVDWFVEPKIRHRFEGPVWVLTNSRTISAAENFVMAMRARARCVVIGEVTAGALADTQSLSIDGDWRFTVPINVFRDANGVSWEGVGLAPDLWLKNTADDILRDSDRVLALAITLAVQDRPYRAAVPPPRE